MSQDLIENLAEIRKRKKQTQSALAEKLGLPQSSIARVESGAVDTRLSRFEDIVRALGYEIVLVPKESVWTIQNILRTAEAGFDPSQTPAYGRPAQVSAFENDSDDDI